ncbi:hypothetical protein QN277_021674 [Acacia crassicarpa]|uniref:Pectinesterase n=1 Tax=Acacia crassicarpa TaxID=499986 RepID=A0AAE1MPN6_9FABA|nr:hypothetical protein QN277_021674 [Acacia crassicarpa]
MAFKPVRFTRSLFILLSFFALSSLADSPAASPVIPPDALCDSTRYPALCKTVLRSQNGTVFDFGRVLLRRSLSQSQIFLNQVDSYLQSSSSLSQPTIGALKDCSFLAGLNIEFLSDALNAVQNLNDFLSSSQAQDLETLFSAVLTNQQTCQDGLQTTASDGRVKDDLSSSLSNDSKLHSVSLALFTKGWVPQKNTTTSWPNNRRLLDFLQSRIFDSTSRSHDRKLLQSVNGSVVVTGSVVVSQDGSGNFTTINDAINAAPNNTASGAGYFLIFITSGVYQEYVSIPKYKQYLMIVGDGINRTIITGDHNVVDGYTTFNSATFAVVAQGFVAVNITFRNTAGAIKHQAVAMRSGADLSVFYLCSFEGYQDTLYTHSMRQFYRECDIYGTVDFIFGNAAVVMQNCNLYPRLPLSGQFNTITAQGRTDPGQNTGTSIQNATIKAADDLAPSVGTVQTYLGRPWKEYSRTVFMESWIDSLINPAGWHDWNGTFALSTLYYAEYNNSGPGSNTSNRVTWPGYHVINATDAVNFTVANFLIGDAWLPPTGVPHYSGFAS